MEYKEGRLGYNRKNDRYGLLVTDLWEIDGFSCGNRLQVEINGGFALLTFASRLFHFALSII